MAIGVHGPKRFIVILYADVALEEIKVGNFLTTSVEWRQVLIKVANFSLTSARRGAPLRSSYFPICKSSIKARGGAGTAVFC